MKLNSKLVPVISALVLVAGALYLATLNEVAVAQVKNLGVPTAEKQVQIRKEKLKKTPECQVYADELDSLANLSAASGSTFNALNKVMAAAQEKGCVGP